MRDDATAALRAFRLIAEHGSFTRAAVVLEITPSALSQTLRQLEQRLGVRLLHRTTRRVGLTEAGRQLLARIVPALKELDGALEDLRQHEEHPRGTLRVTVPNVVLPWLIEPMLAEFARAWPDVQLDIRVDDGLVDLVGEGFDAGIRLGERLQKDMVAAPLTGPVRAVVVARPITSSATGAPAIRATWRGTTA